MTRVIRLVFEPVAAAGFAAAGVSKERGAGAAVAGVVSPAASARAAAAATEAAAPALP